MSVKIMSQVWELDLSNSELLVLLAMADHADHEGNNVYPSIALIAWKTGLSERHTHRIIKKLTDSNILQIQEKRAGKTTKYRIDCSQGTIKIPFRTPDTMSPPPLTSDVIPTPDIAVSYESSLEPSFESKDSSTTPKNGVDGTAKIEPQDDTPQPEKTKDATTQLLEVEENIDRRLAIALTVNFEKRPADLWTVNETTGKKTLRSGGKSDPFYLRVTSIFELFTVATKQPLGRAVDWFVKETSYEVSDLIACWQFIRREKNLTGETCPYNVQSGKNKGLRWALDEWKKSNPTRLRVVQVAQHQPEPPPTPEEEAAKRATLEEVRSYKSPWAYIEAQKEKKAG